MRGDIVLSIINEIQDREKVSRLSDFEFNWGIQGDFDALLFGAYVEKEIVGLVEFSRVPKYLYNLMHLIEVRPDFRGSTVAGELLAWVGLDSFNQGFDGFVLFEAKSSNYEMYIEKYGAKPIRGRRLSFDTDATRKLIQTYLEVHFD